jgi:hypothetical protein
MAIANDTRRNATHNCIGRDILCYDGSGGNDCPMADCDPRNYLCAATYPDIVPDLCKANDLSTREFVVRFIGLYPLVLFQMLKALANVEFETGLKLEWAC